MRKLLTLKAIQLLKGDDAMLEEILRALRRSEGNMRDACETLGVGKSSMYRILEELGPSARAKVDELIAEKGFRIRGKVLDREGAEQEEAPAPVAPARQRTKTRGRKTA